MITKEQVQEIINQPGMIRGDVFNTDAVFIKQKEGPEALDKLKKEAENLGFSIPYGTAEFLEWKPIGLRVMSFILVTEVLGWSENDLKEMGYNAPKASFIVKLLTKHFLSLEKILKETPEYWRKHYTIGKLEPEEINMDKRYCILRIYNFKTNPLFCPYWLGYFKRIGEFSGHKVTEMKNTVCMADKVPYSEFIIRWE